MKKRVISAIIAFIILIPIFLKGGLIFDITFYIIAMLALKELLDAYEVKNKIPDLMRLISYLLITLIYFFHNVNNNLILNIDYRVVTGLFFLILLPIVLYHDYKKYNIADAFYLLGGIFFLGSSFSMFSLYRNLGLDIVVYLFLITIITDTFAYISGSLIGKHKLLEVVSPKKTWEGFICGSFVGTAVSVIYYLTVINSAVSLPVIIGVTLFLTLVGQIGDLFFSAIKRYYGVKDFSNIMPGHGGILDRLDSIIFVMLAFTFFISII
jgi:phosphatidate cytidylyltransferase